MSRLLVCAPEHFTVEYEINPWMRLSNTVNADRARAQWQGLVHELEHRIRVKLEHLAPVPGLPDLVFTANAGVVVIVSRWSNLERNNVVVPSWI